MKNIKYEKKGRTYFLCFNSPGFLGGTFPNLGGIFPYFGETLPDLGEVVPDLGGTIPDLGEAVPDLGGAIPDLGETVPYFGGTLPDLGENIKYEKKSRTKNAAGTRNNPHRLRHIVLYHRHFRLFQAKTIACLRV